MVSKADLFDLFIHRSTEAKVLRVPISRVLGSDWRERYHTRVDTMITTRIYETLLSAQDKEFVRDQVKIQLWANFEIRTRLDPQMLLFRALCDNDQEYEKRVKEVVGACMNSSEDLVSDLEKKVIVKIILEINDGQKIKAMTDAFFDQIESNISGQELEVYLHQRFRQQEMHNFFKEVVLKSKGSAVLP